MMTGRFSRSAVHALFMLRDKFRWFPLSIAMTALLWRLLLALDENQNFRLVLKLIKMPAGSRFSSLPAFEEAFWAAPAKSTVRCC